MKENGREQEWKGKEVKEEAKDDRGKDRAEGNESKRYWNRPWIIPSQDIKITIPNNAVKWREGGLLKGGNKNQNIDSEDFEGKFTCTAAHLDARSFEVFRVN